MSQESKNYAHAIVAVLIAIGAALIARSAWPGDLPGSTAKEALQLSQVVLVGLAITVAMMAALAALYSAFKLSNPAQALGLPEGSVRALIAFSLVLIFVCLSAFIYNGLRSVENVGAGKMLKRVDAAALNDLKSDFAVAYEPALDDKGGAMKDGAGQPLYNATYYSRRSKDADDFGKQLFTTLSTVFVSVISFYFGSSVTSSGVAAGTNAAKALQGSAPGPNAGDGGAGKGDGTTSVAAAAAPGTLTVASLSQPVPRTG